MPWGKLDDKFHRNRKVRELRKMGAKGREALGIWVFWWSWCLDAGGDFDGLVPAEELSAADAKLAPLLVEVGLWDVVDSGYRFHDFDAYNPTKKQVQEKRDKDRDRQRQWRESQRLSQRDTDSDEHCDDARDSLPRARAGSGSGGEGVSRNWPAVAEHHRVKRGMDQIPSADALAAKEVARVFGDAWLPAYGRWEADPWVAANRPPLSHLANAASKYGTGGNSAGGYSGIGEVT